MTSIINRGISLYKEKGARILFQKAFDKIRRDIHDKLVVARGQYSLNLDDISVQFSAPTITMVRRNQSRFESEREEISDFVNMIEKSDVVYDIGANTGLYSLFAAQKCPEGQVISFEPYPPNLNLLKRDIARNKIQNIKVVDVALSDTVGNVEFSQPAEEDVGYGSASIESKMSKGTIKIPTTTGQRLIEDGEIPAPNIVKIDVEGSEPLVIEGLEKALSAPRCRAVYCEVHLSGVDRRPSVDDFDSSPKEIRERLESYGFTVERVDDFSRTEITYKALK
ncbi:FkbM family methyltransferase [Haloferax sp. YSMS24]|uniref:FkbM family methyltransferase n=1 Tax=Haloferax sp. YSMS24 TaxID=3388425 RepID=UPI00398D106A